MKGFSFYSYFVTGALAVVLSWIMSGCRLGNNVVTEPNSDGVSGYYQTLPQSFQYCASFTDQEVCAEVATNFIPSLVATALTNPVALILSNQNTGSAYLVDPFGDGSALPVFVDVETLGLSLSATNEPPPSLWGHSECLHRFTVNSQGEVQPGPEVTVAGKTTVGRISIDHTVIDTFDGDCTAALQEMENCYLDHMTCGGVDENENLALQADVQSFYQLAIDDAGVMTADDISNVLALAYTVSHR